MTDYSADTGPKGQGGDAGETSRFDEPFPPAADDPLAALERLESLGSREPRRDAGKRPARAGLTRPSGRVAHAAHARPAAVPGAGRLVARIAAPVVFLIAVIAFASIVVSSGIVGGGSTPQPGASPTPSATKTKASTAPTASPGTATVRTYRIKSGDTLSAIAAKYGVTVSAILDLNPDVSSSTLVVGHKIKIPTQ